MCNSNNMMNNQAPQLPDDDTDSQQQPQPMDLAMVTERPLSSIPLAPKRRSLPSLLASASVPSFPKQVTHNRYKRSISCPSSITFNPEVRVRTVENIDDLSQEQIHAVWYNTEDYKLIRRREKSLMKRVSLQRQQQRRAEQENTTSLSTLPQCPSLIHKVLALETREERDERCRTIREVQLVVLCEQSNYSTERLARLYSRITSPCVLAARDRGLNVEIVMRNLEVAEASAEDTARTLVRNASERRWSADCGQHSDSCNTSCVRKRSMDWTPSSSPVAVISPTSVLRGMPPIEALQAAVHVTQAQEAATTSMTHMGPQEPAMLEPPMTLANWGQ